MFLDLDDFKSVNDSYRHETGALVSKEVAQRLKCVLRESDIVPRLGGVEFTVLLTSVSSVEDVKRVGKKVLETLEEPTVINGHNIKIAASIGISLFPEDTSDVQHLLDIADGAMYAAKDNKVSRVALYSEPA